jgi:5S rRNA maturation endonuclease (ribonuclease M5)
MGGRKTFVTNTVLTTADVQDFLMDQSVMVFADSDARGSAIATPTEGMVAYLNNSNLMSIYDGANWKTSLATTGSVLQAVTQTTTTEVSTSSTSFVTTNLELSITPKSTSNKILILVSGDAYTLAAGRSVIHTIFRGGAGGTNLLGANGFGATFSSGTDVFGHFSAAHLDSPNTTSATTYTLMFRAGTAASVRGIANFGQITMLEIAG